MKYSAVTRGFYCQEVHSSIPADAVDVTADEYADLMAGQAQGGRIEPGPGGRPVLVQPEAIDPLQQERERMVVSRFQARAALYLAGLLPQVEAAVAAASDPMVQIAWADAQEFTRNSPTIAALAPAVGLTEAQIDDLFRTAAQITA